MYEKKFKLSFFLLILFGLVESSYAQGNMVTSPARNSINKNQVSICKGSNLFLNVTGLDPLNVDLIMFDCTDPAVGIQYPGQLKTGLVFSTFSGMTLNNIQQNFVIYLLTYKKVAGKYNIIYHDTISVVVGDNSVLNNVKMLSPTFTSCEGSKIYLKSIDSAFFLTHASSLTFSWKQLPSGASSWGSVTDGTNGISGASGAFLEILANPTHAGVSYKCDIVFDNGCSASTNAALVAVNTLPKQILFPKKLCLDYVDPTTRSLSLSTEKDVQYTLYSDNYSQKFIGTGLGLSIQIPVSQNNKVFWLNAQTPQGCSALIDSKN